MPPDWSTQPPTFGGIVPTHETRDSSTNFWWVALLAYGEGWHNNHLAFQTSARHGLRWWDVDITYLSIRVLSALGVAHSVKLPTLKAKMRDPDCVCPHSAVVKTSREPNSC
jgi:fatty-acid desaturase